MKSDVVAAARDEFWERGYAATSVDDLTAATGLGKGSLYGAFGDKHSLYLRALDDYIASSLDDVRASLRNPSMGAYERLARHIRGQAKALVADKGRRGCLMAKSAAELARHRRRRRGRKWSAPTQPGATNSSPASRKRSATETVDAKQNPQALAGTLLAFMRGQEALHKGGAKPAQLKAAADEMVSLIPTG